MVRFRSVYSPKVRYSQKLLQATVEHVFKRVVSKGLIKNVNGFLLKRCNGSLSVIEALFGGNLNDLIVSEADHHQLQLSRSNQVVLNPTLGLSPFS